MSTKISVIIPVYNRQHFLSACLDSILAQTYQDWECIVVDDGSDDLSTAVINTYAERDKRFLPLYCKHQGVIAALNTGFKQAREEFVCRFDSDDIMPAARLEQQVRVLRKLGRGNVVCGKVKCFCAGKPGRGYKRYVDWLNRMDQHDDFKKNIFIECPFVSTSWLAYNQDIKELDFYDENIYPEDYNLAFKMITAGYKIHSLKDIVLYWRDHPERISRTRSEYADQRFWDLKLHYFLRYFADSRQIYIWGAGRNGKKLFKKLYAYSRQPHGFITDNRQKQGNTLYGCRVIPPAALPQNVMVLAAVAARGARAEIRNYLLRAGKTELRDFYIFC